MAVHSFDVVIVGAGIAGSALAHALASLAPPPPRPLRICLLERSLAEPDRIVGELLQPGGVRALHALGLAHTLDAIDAVPVHGYCVLDASQRPPRQVHIPYLDGTEGRSFHHGRFVVNLRAAAQAASGVDVREATVVGLVACPYTGRVLGVRARPSAQEKLVDVESPSTQTDTFLAPLTVIADGCFSNLRSSVLASPSSPSSSSSSTPLPRPRLHHRPTKPVTRSHFVGAVLPNASLPIPQHGTVALVPGAGPVLLYQIANENAQGGTDTRMLVDVKAPLPSDLKGHIRTAILPHLPASLQPSIEGVLDSPDRLRQMPNSFLPPRVQGAEGTKEGAILLGDAWNMRHPLTGGGMTVALGDVVLLRGYIGELLAGARVKGEVTEKANGHANGHTNGDAEEPTASPDLDSDADPIHAALSNWARLSPLLHRWHWERKPLASTINILSVALYDLFGADGDALAVLRTGCFKYFERGGECVRGPVGLLSGVTPSPLTLAYHFFSVALYAIWVLFAHPRAYGTPGGEAVVRRAYVWEYPALVWLSVRAFWTACIVFGPLVWSEVRWW